MRVVATYNLKGGVGKTSAAVNLAGLAALDGLRVLLWDLDPQGSATYLLRIKPKVRGGGRRLVRGKTEIDPLLRGSDVEGLDVLPADFTYRNLDLALEGGKRSTTRIARLLAPLADQYDLVVLDCPPSISLLSENVFEAADALLIPLIPATLSLRTYEQLRTFIAREVPEPPELIPFLSMVDRRKRLHRDVLDALAGNVARAVIPAATEVELMGVQRMGVEGFAPASRPARAYRALWDEVAARLGLAPSAARASNPLR